ncbi:MAG: Mu transposase C-terminal domain-containing protein [Thermodesulfobacteriota bacterium]|nr:Mu transposase C-terminal domain-containing protein [Thermodesulfobacteriota bacterium]
MSSNKKYLLTIIEFARYEGVTVKTVRRKIKSNVLSVVKVKGENGYRKNHPENRLHYSQLSTPEAQESALKDRGLLDPPKPEPQPVEEPKIYDLKPYQKEEADRREKIVKEKIEESKDVPLGKRTVWKRSFAKRHGISYRTSTRWEDAYKTGGYYALVPNWNAGDQKRIIDKKLAKFIEETYLKPYGPTIRATWEQACKWCDDRNQKPPSYRTVVDFINKKWTKGQRLLVRDKLEWDRLYRPFVRRDWEKEPVNGTWFGDAKQLDIWVIYRGKPIRPWITAWLDARSRKFVGHILWPTHNSWTIAQSFVYAVSKHGAPKTVYIDHGKDYKSTMLAGTKVKDGPTIKLFEGIEKTIILGAWRDSGCNVLYSAPYNPPEKNIESNWNGVNQICADLSAYCGNGKNRGLQKKALQDIKAGRGMEWEDFVSIFDQKMKERNAKPHSQTGVPPDSFYENFTPIIPSQELLDYLLMDVHLKKVKDSTVTIEGLVYRGEELWRLAGEEVEIRRDPQNITRAVIIYKGKVFGSAYLEQADHYKSAITLDSVKTARRIRKRTKKWRELVIENQDFIDDPLRMAVELDSEGTPRQRDIRPVDSKVVGINKKSRIAKDVKKALREGERQQQERKTAVGGGDSLISQLLSSFEREKDVEEAPRYRLVDLDIDD